MGLHGRLGSPVMTKWGFPQLWGVPQQLDVLLIGTSENKIDDLRVPPFSETPKWFGFCHDPSPVVMDDVIGQKCSVTTGDPLMICVDFLNWKCTRHVFLNNDYILYFGRDFKHIQLLSVNERWFVGKCSFRSTFP